MTGRTPYLVAAIVLFVLAGMVALPSVSASPYVYSALLAFGLALLAAAHLP